MFTYYKKCFTINKNINVFTEKKIKNKTKYICAVPRKKRKKETAKKLKKKRKETNKENVKEKKLPKCRVLCEWVVHDLATLDDVLLAVNVIVGLLF